MRMVNDSSCASIKRFEAAAKLAPENIGGLVIRRLKVACNFLVGIFQKGAQLTCRHILYQVVICMAPFQLCLPQVMMSVDEP